MLIVWPTLRTDMKLDRCPERTREKENMNSQSDPVLDREKIDNKVNTKPINKTMGFAEWFLIAVLSIIWGGSFFFIEITIREMTPLTIVLCRVGFAAVVLLIYVYLSGQKMPTTPSLWGTFLIMGLLNNLIPFSLIVWWQKYIDSSLASIINATSPIFSVLLAHILTREEHLTQNRMIGVLMGWVGVVLLIGIDSLKGFGIHIMGQIAVLCAALSYAFAAIYGRRFKDISPSVVAAGPFTQHENP